MQSTFGRTFVYKEILSPSVQVSWPYSVENYKKKQLRVLTVLFFALMWIKKWREWKKLCNVFPQVLKVSSLFDANWFLVSHYSLDHVFQNVARSIVNVRKMKRLSEFRYLYSTISDITTFFYIYHIQKKKKDLTWLHD